MLPCLFVCQVSSWSSFFSANLRCFANIPSPHLNPHSATMCNSNVGPRCINVAQKVKKMTSLWSLQNQDMPTFAFKKNKNACILLYVELSPKKKVFDTFDISKNTSDKGRRNVRWHYSAGCHAKDLCSNPFVTSLFLRFYHVSALLSLKTG